MPDLNDEPIRIAPAAAGKQAGMRLSFLVVGALVIAFTPGTLSSMSSISWSFVTLILFADVAWASRAAMVSMELTRDGVIIRNPIRTFQATWTDVRAFKDGHVIVAAGQSQWALGVLTSDGTWHPSVGTAWARSRAEREGMLAAVGQGAAARGIPMVASPPAN